MKDYEEIMASIFALWQGMDKNPEWVGAIIDKVVNTPKDQQQIWLESFTATIKVLMENYPQIKEHDWFKDNPLVVAKGYVEFHEEQRDKENK